VQNSQNKNNKKYLPNRRKIMEVRIIINNGKIEIFEDEFKNSPLKSIFENSNVIERKRVSHIYPQNLILRTIFKTLRKLFGDNGKIADWTRNWKCKWQVEILGQLPTTYNKQENSRKALPLALQKARSPALKIDENKSEKKIFKGFKDRKIAIDFEKNYIINQKTKKF
jgi:hypothetical protein